MTLNKKNGFTLVEISLVLGIAALMLIGFMSGIAATINRQRYTDATNDFADFLRRMYSETINVQNSRSGSLFTYNNGEEEFYYCNLAGISAHESGELSTSSQETDGLPGRTNCAIYGKLINFGEKDDNTIYIYDVVGLAVDIHNPVSASSTAGELAAVYVDTLTLSQGSNGICSVSPAGAMETYHTSWGASIETAGSDTHEPFRGALLIVRSPNSGAIRTYVMEGQVMGIQEVIDKDTAVSCNSITPVMTEVSMNRASLVDHLNGTDLNQQFEMKDADFCVSYDGLFSSLRQRNNIRVVADGHNSTAVQFIETNLSPEEGGNRC